MSTATDAATTAPRTAPLEAGTSQPAGLLWGIGAVATRTKIPAATLRNWDRRYGIGPSAHSDGGHRRYDEGDISRLTYMARLIDDGAAVLAASEVAASLSVDEIDAL
ncbi:MerR family transcriptional regulator [Solicola sp. PLA-1-18]|uniref:MerR family transcriptional regulator n=1 Tax=Solicola sp. PLA-1-18 TaxID=3380532 RepID=UPI003B829341